MPDWLLQAIMSQIAWEIVLMLGAGAILGFLKRKLPQYADVALYGFVGAACVAVMWFATTGRAMFYKEPLKTTTENIQSNVNGWLADYGVSVRKVDDPEAYFNFETILHDGVGLNVIRPQNRGKYLSISTSLKIPPGLKTKIDKLPMTRKREITNQISLEMARAKVRFYINFPNVIVISDELPITDDMTDDTLLKGLDNVDDGLILARTILDMNHIL